MNRDMGRTHTFPTQSISPSLEHHPSGIMILAWGIMSRLTGTGLFPTVATVCSTNSRVSCFACPWATHWSTATCPTFLFCESLSEITKLVKAKVCACFLKSQKHFLHMYCPGRQNLSRRHNGYREVQLNIKIMMRVFFFPLSVGMKRTEGEKSPWAQATEHATTVQCRLASVYVSTFKADFEQG